MNISSLAWALLAVLVLACASVAARDPELILTLVAGLVGLGIMVAVVAHPPAALLALLVAAPLEGMIALPGPLSSFGASKITAVMVLLSFAVAVLRGRLAPQGDVIYVLLVALFATAVLSAAVTTDPVPALGQALRLAGFLALVPVVAVIAPLMGVRTVLWAWVAATAASAVAGLHSFATGATALATRSGVDPNDFAFQTAVAVPMALALTARNGPSRWPRLLAGVSLALLLTATLASLSRGAVAGLLAGAVWHFVAVPRHRRALLAWGAGLAVAAAASAAWWLQTAAEALSRKEVSAGENVDSRLQAWGVALQLAADRPVLGTGPGRFGDYYRDLTDTPQLAFGLDVVHNTWLGVLAELGVLAFLLLVAVLSVAWLRLGEVPAGAAVPSARAQVWRADLRVSVRTAILVAAVAATFTNQEYAESLWLLTGLAIALGPAAPATRRSQKPQRTEIPA